MTYSPGAELAFPGGRLERAVNEKLLADSGPYPDYKMERASGAAFGLGDLLPHIEVVDPGKVIFDGDGSSPFATGVYLMKDPSAWGKADPLPTRIQKVAPGSPARDAGLEPGDRILRVNGKDVTGMPVAEVARHLSGDAATWVDLEVERGGKQESYRLLRRRVEKAPARKLDDLLKPKDSVNCPSSPEYDMIIDEVAQRIYDPMVMGDLKEMHAKFNCDIARAGHPEDFANASLGEKADRFTFYRRSGGAGEISAPPPAGEEGSVGAMLSRATSDDTGTVMVARVLPESPAEKAGLRRGDLIKNVDGKDITETPLNDVVLAVRGKPGSDVALSIIRHGVPKEIDITRSLSSGPVDTVDRDLGKGIAYIRLVDFADPQDVGEMRKALERHSDARAFVIDLRENPGGRVDGTLQMLSLFIDEGPLMKIRERVPSSPEAPRYQSVDVSLDSSGLKQSELEDGAPIPRIGRQPRQPDLVKGRPVVVLVNDGSASASEIFTGAMKDNSAATIVGERTFGKGIGQAQIQDPDGELKVTVLRYTSPKGHWPGDADRERYGIEPDVKVSNSDDGVFGTDSDAQLRAAIDILAARIPQTDPEAPWYRSILEKILGFSS
ncbi:MAG: PDZ domain-containing protein [Cyanobacteria bacterium HKST-UBA02]|nr:PDZ domain-containing protein [Cyanobacteria bacterium HKST-UBA02]